MKKGFTLIELITTFALAAVVIVILINIIIVIKDIYTSSSVKTELYLNQSNLSVALHSKFTDKSLATYSSCGDSCYEFLFNNGENEKLVVTDDKITFGNYVYKLGEGSSIGDFIITKENIEVSDSNMNDSFLIINIPITNKKYPNENFGVKIVYPYNSNLSSI